MLLIHFLHYLKNFFSPTRARKFLPQNKPKNLSCHDGTVEIGTSNKTPSMLRFRLQRIYEHLKESVKPKVKITTTGIALLISTGPGFYTACPNLISFVSVNYALAFCPPVASHNL